MSQEVLSLVCLLLRTFLKHLWLTEGVRPNLGQMTKLRPVARKTGSPDNMDGAGLLQNGGGFSKRRNTRQTKVVMPSNLGVLYYTAATGPLFIVFSVNGVC